MKKTIILAIAMSLSVAAFSQKYFTKSGKIHFSSETPIEKIEATNNSATSVIDAASGNVEFAVLIKGFLFEKALMQEHFNENYMESTKFPKATFKGKIDNFATVNLSKDGSYPVKISGKLTMHGATQDIKSDGKITVKGGVITNGTSSFSVRCEDYQIAIPALVKEKIAKNINISISSEYQKM
jgi:polyisoprenoid-binding protein YceI